MSRPAYVNQFGNRLASVCFGLLTTLLLAGCDSGGDANDLQSRVEVAANSYTSLQMMADNSIIEVGQELQMELNALRQTETDGDSVAGSAVWTVNNTDIATIDNTGLLTGLTNGTVTVNARYGPLFAETTVQVSNAELVSLQVEASDTEVKECESVQLKALGNYGDGLGLRDLTDEVDWTDSSLTTVGAFNSADNAGFYRTTASGQLQVTASRDNIVVDPPFTLNVLGELSTITIPDLTSTLTTSANVQLRATGNYSDGSTSEITDNASWRVSSTTVATIDNSLPSKGLLDASQTGSLTVFATCGVNNTEGSRDLLSGDPQVVESVFFGRSSPFVISFSETVTLNLKAYARLETQERVDITEDSDWTLITRGNGANSLSNSSGSKGELTIRGTGEIVVQVEYTGDEYDESTLNIPRLTVNVQ